MVSFAILYRKTLPILKDKKLEADFTPLLEKYIFYSVLQGSTPTFDTEPKKAEPPNGGSAVGRGLPLPYTKTAIPL